MIGLAEYDLISAFNVKVGELLHNAVAISGYPTYEFNISPSVSIRIYKELSVNGISREAVAVVFLNNSRLGLSGLFGGGSGVFGLRRNFGEIDANGGRGSSDCRSCGDYRYSGLVGLRLAA